MDEFDVAQRYEESAREEALARVRASITGKSSREDCLDCGDDIPPARRAAVPGVERCVTCQGIFERAIAQGR